MALLRQNAKTFFLFAGLSLLFAFWACLPGCSQQGGIAVYKTESGVLIEGVTGVKTDYRITTQDKASSLTFSIPDQVVHPALGWRTHRIEVLNPPEDWTSIQMGEDQVVTSAPDMAALPKQRTEVKTQLLTSSVGWWLFSAFLFMTLVGGISIAWTQFAGDSLLSFHVFLLIVFFAFGIGWIMPYGLIYLASVLISWVLFFKLRSDPFEDLKKSQQWLLATLVTLNTFVMSGVLVLDKDYKPIAKALSQESLLIYPPRSYRDTIVLLDENKRKVAEFKVGTGERIPAVLLLAAKDANVKGIQFVSDSGRMLFKEIDFSRLED